MPLTRPHSLPRRRALALFEIPESRSQGRLLMRASPKPTPNDVSASRLRAQEIPLRESWQMVLAEAAPVKQDHCSQRWEGLWLPQRT